MRSVKLLTALRWDRISISTFGTAFVFDVIIGV